MTTSAMIQIDHVIFACDEHCHLEQGADGSDRHIGRKGHFKNVIESHTDKDQLKCKQLVKYFAI